MGKVGGGRCDLNDRPARAHAHGPAYVTLAAAVSGASRSRSRRLESEVWRWSPGNGDEQPLGSYDAFERCADRHRELGFTDLVLHWPRPDAPNDASSRVLERTAARLG
jgi:hypothetical protein